MASRLFSLGWLSLTIVLLYPTAAIAQDCNNNGIPDPNDITFRAGSGQLSPIGDTYPQSFSLIQPPTPSGNVTLSFRAIGDLSAPLEVVQVSVNGIAAGTIFASGAHDCPTVPDTASLTINRTTFETMLANGGGDVMILMTASSNVDATLCADPFISVRVTYTINDCNANGAPDECDTDCNGNEIPDDCDIAAETSADCNNNGIPDECEGLVDTDGDGFFDDCDNCADDYNPDQADCDGDGIGDVCAIAQGLAADCDRNGVPDLCDVDESDPDGDGLVAVDCDENGVPDSCEPDCNGNGIVDTCDIDPSDPDGNGQVNPDCDGNGVPDSCDLADCDPGDPGCQDCNGNGIPDRCDPDCDGNGIPDDCDIDPTDPDGDGQVSPDCDGNGVPDVCDLNLSDPDGNGQVAKDCNNNGVPDVCDIDPSNPDGDGEVSFDCNANNVPDECDLASGTSQDCNGNETPDECDLDPSDPDGDGFTSLDCDTNGTPDECETDCNGNGVPDLCDVDPNDPDHDGQVFADCNGNGVPDECDILDCDPGDPSCQDCNGNDIPDGCEMDCNENGVPDDCDIRDCDPEDPTCADCNGNEIPDSCDITELYTDASSDLSPIGNGSPQEYTLQNPPRATGNVTLRFEAKGDFDSSAETVTVTFAGSTLGTLYETGAGRCSDPPSVGTLTITKALFNAAIDAGDTTITMTPSVYVDASDCSGASMIRVTAEYPFADCNGNGIPDDCDIALGTSGDCNANGTPDECEPDCNNNEIPDECDILGCDPGDPTCQDCNGNGVPDGCEPGGADDCNTNGVPDLCDIATGASDDDNENGIPDECETDVATFLNVQSNGVLGDPANETRTWTFLGGYAQGRIDWTGVLTLLHTTTFGADASVEITHPSGVRRTFSLNPIGQSYNAGPTYNESGSIPQTVSPAASSFGLGVDPAGTWTFRFYESYDDGGSSAVDARWDNIVLTLTDEIPTKPTPPATAVDLGTLSGESTTTGTIAVNKVKWFRFTISEAAAALSGSYVDIDTEGTTLSPSNDTEIALFDEWGQRLAVDDDGASGMLSLLSFGAGSGVAAGVGQNGDLFPGTYYLAVGAFDTTFGTSGFSAGSASSNTGAIHVNFNVSADEPSVPGDVDGDGVVNLTDLGMLLVAYNTCAGDAAYNAAADVNSSGCIDLTDLGLLLANYGG